MRQTEPPTVVERQRVERLIAAVMAGLDAQQAIGAAVPERLGIVTAVILSEAAEDVYNEPAGAEVHVSAPEYRRYFALSQLFEAMVQLAGAGRFEAT